MVQDRYKLLNQNRPYLNHQVRSIFCIGNARKLNGLSWVHARSDRKWWLERIRKLTARRRPAFRADTRCLNHGKSFETKGFRSFFLLSFCKQLAIRSTDRSTNKELLTSFKRKGAKYGNYLVRSFLEEGLIFKC